MGSVVLLFASCASLSPTALDARQTAGAGPEPGVRVRVLDARGRPLGDGLLGSITRDSIQLRPPDGAPLGFGRADVAALEVHEGTRRRWLAGAAIGLGAGLGIVATRELLASACALSVNGECAHPRDRYFLSDVDAAVIIGAGVLIGAAAGSLLVSDRWRGVSWPTVTPSASRSRVVEIGVRIGVG